MSEQEKSDSNEKDLNSEKYSWQVSEDAKIGRILTATRDIKPFEIVIDDTALIYGPKVTPVCLGCLGPISGDIVCSSCQWPMCSLKCQEEPCHQAECEVFTSRRLTPDNKGFYPCVTVLRVLMLKKTDPEGWSLIQKMMDHWPERSKDKKVVEGIMVMTKLFKGRLGLDWVTLNDVEKSYGVLKTNAVDIKDGAGQALFPKSVCIMSHSCAANLEPVRHPHNHITLRAKRKIKKGEELTIFYTDFLEARHSIRGKILNEWKFWCLCVRCRDPTELGSNFSSFQCSCGGYFHEDPSDVSCLQNNFRSCSKCQKEVDLVNKYEMADKLFEILPSEEITIEKIEAVLDSDGFHKQHYLVIKLITLFIDQKQHTTDRETLEFIIDKCDILLTTMSQLEEGCSRLAGKYLGIRANCQTRLVKIKHANKEISDVQLKTSIEQVLKCKILVAKLRN